MVIIYNLGTEFKMDKELETSKCENCGYTKKTYLMREVFVFKLFYIPIIHRVKRRGIMCSHCGKIKELSKADYKEQKDLA